MSTDRKLSRISKIIPSCGSFRFWLANLGRKALANVAIPLARDNLPELLNNLSSSAINKFKK